MQKNTPRVAEQVCLFGTIGGKGWVKGAYMNITKIASAGTMESSDAYVEVAPGTGTVEVSVESVVEGQFGAAIERSIREVVEECGVSSVQVRIKDRGALDCTIRARTEAAIKRAGGEE